MNSALALETPGSEPLAQTAAQRAGWPERLVMRLLRRLTVGGLKLVRTDGRTEILGQPGAAITAELRILRPDFFRRCLLHGNIGLGEAYTQGDWETDDIAAVISWFIVNLAQLQGSEASSYRLPGVNLLRFCDRVLHLLRPNSVATSRRNIAEHYDLGNDFYALWLDETMTYSAARFEHPDQPLADAQRSKYDALCRKLQLGPNDHVLEIGCGWGGFCTHAARTHGCRVTSVTISREQFDYARARVRREGLEHLVEIRLQDYRHIEGRFDKIASIEMLEAVGDAYVDGYFAKCQELLKPHGLLAFQVITTPDCRYENLRRGVDWIQKHIFPGSLLLSLARINQAVNRAGDLFLHGLEDLGSGYARTLHLWHDRFNARLDEVRAQGFDETFIRKWNYYLKYCEAAFATRNISVIQAVYTRPNNPTLHRAW